jgi:hypothetical protein
MSAAFVKGAGAEITRVQPANTEQRPPVIASYLAPLLSGFALGAGLGVLLWHLF